MCWWRPHLVIHFSKFETLTFLRLKRLKNKFKSRIECRFSSTSMWSEKNVACWRILYHCFQWVVNFSPLPRTHVPVTWTWPDWDAVFLHETVEVDGYFYPTPQFHDLRAHKKTRNQLPFESPLPAPSCMTRKICIKKWETCKQAVAVN